MKSKEILDKLEGIISNEINESEKNKTDSEDNSDKDIVKNIKYLALSFFVNILKSPFKIIAKYLRDEIFTAIKNDAKLYAIIMGIMGVLFVFFSVLWLFISIAIGVYFFEKGQSILLSVTYSIVFQIFSFILISLIALVASSKLKSLKIMKKLNNYNEK